MRRAALFNLSANLFNVWFNGKLDSDICLCTQSISISGKTMR